MKKKVLVSGCFDMLHSGHIAFLEEAATYGELTISIEPKIKFNDRSGMASSTRKRAVELWKTAIPQGDRDQLAKILFTYDNPPRDGNRIGFPGFARHRLAGTQQARLRGGVLAGIHRIHL